MSPHGRPITGTNTGSWREPVPVEAPPPAACYPGGETALGPAAMADTFGVGVSATTIQRRCRAEVRALLSGTRWPLVVRQSQRRAVAQALLDALPSQWLRRAEELEAARSKPGDYLGNATEEELRASDQRLAESARNCRRHAWLLTEFGLPGHMTTEIEDVLDEGAV